MIGSRIDVIEIRPAMDPRGAVIGILHALAIVKPEGNIDTCDLFHTLGIRKVFRQKGFPFAKLQKCLFGIFLSGFERKDRIRFLSGT